MFSFLTPYMLWIKIGLAILVISTAIGNTHHFDKIYYEGVIAKTEAARADAVSKQLEARNNFIIEKNKIKEEANGIQQENNVTINDLSSKLRRMHFDFTTASSTARLLRDALHASSNTSSGVVSTTGNSVLSSTTTEESNCEIRLKELLLEADRENIDAIRLNAQIRPIVKE